MHPLKSIKKIKELWYNSPNGDQLTVPVPEELNQSLLKYADPNDYLVTTVVVGREIAEAEITTLKCKGDTVGFLIPGQAILSKNHPKNNDKFFGTYSLIAALVAFQRAKNHDFTLFENKTPASSRDIFSSGHFYAVVWIKRLNIKEPDFYQKYFVSLANSGIYKTNEFNKPIASSRTLDSYNTEISISTNKDWPAYISLIITQLSPYATDPFLRFFYLYQVIETLMAENYVERQDEIRNRFNKNPKPSITVLKDFLDEFKSIVNEAPRINSVLNPGCVDTNQSADDILGKLGIDHSELTFGAKIYKIRNTIFHEYKTILHMSHEITILEDRLLSYILSQKL